MYRLFRQSKHLSTSLISIPALSIPQPNTSFFTPKSSYTKKNAVNTQKPVRKIVKERIEGGANEKAVLRLFINCPFVCINFDFFWLNKARQLYMDF